MQTGTISFCGKQGLNIKSDDAKRNLNDTLKSYNVDILKKHFEKYTEHSDARIKQKPHLLSLKSNGNPYVLFLTKFNDVDTCIFVDKKIQHGYFLPRMIIDRLSFHSELFSNTIIDGEMVKVTEDEWVYLMNDIFVYKSRRTNRYALSDRLKLLNKILSSKYFPIPFQKYSVQIKKYFQNDELDEVMKFKDSLKYTCRGLQYKPTTSTFRYILKNFNDSLIADVKRVKYSETNKFLEGTPNVPFIEPSVNTTKKNSNTTMQQPASDLQLKTFSLQKTERPDVYNIFDPKTDTQMGIASVSTMATSKMLRSAFNDVNLNEKIKFDCSYSERFSKWVPVRQL